MTTGKSSTSANNSQSMLAIKAEQNAYVCQGQDFNGMMRSDWFEIQPKWNCYSLYTMAKKVNRDQSSLGMRLVEKPSSINGC